MRRKNLGEEKAFCFDFRTLDCQKLPFPDAEYDRIIANHVLFYVQNLSRGLQEISRVLSDDGVFYCSTYGKRPYEKRLPIWYRSLIRRSIFRRWRCILFLVWITEKSS